MTAPAYCSAADVARRARIDDPNAAQQQALGASRFIDSECRRRFWADEETSTRVYSTEEPCVLDVDDIATSTGLIVKIDPTGTGLYTTTIGAAYLELDPANQVQGAIEGHPYTTIRAINGAWFPADCHRRRVQVTALWGWSEVPETIATLCAEIAARALEGVTAVRNETIGGYQVGYDRPNTGEAAYWLSKTEQKTLGPYRRTAGVFA